MKILLLIGVFLAQFAFAGAPPEGYPVVQGIVRKVDLSSRRISIKHEDIPNLNMPGMTMSFLAKDLQMLQGLGSGDKVLFVVDEVDGDYTILWIEKVPALDVENIDILCTGVGNTNPKTNVEIEIKRDGLSTIRYEHAEGPYPGTSHVNSIGHLKLHKRGDFYIYRRSVGEQSTRLIFKVNGEQITDACFSNYNANMNSEPVQCSFL